MSFARIKRPSEVAGVEDLDVTPIMNLFVILIPFLVSMAVFTHYTSIHFSLPSSASVGGGGPTEDDLKLTLVVHEEKVQMTLGAETLKEVQFSEGNLVTTIESLLPELKRQDEVVVAPHNGVNLDQVITVMDQCRQAGFAKVALSEAFKEEEG